MSDTLPVDERIERIGLTTLARNMRRRTLRNMDIRQQFLVIQDNGKSVGVLVGYDTFVDLQRGLRDGSELAYRVADKMGIPAPPE